jgi:hypothetical protein
VPQGQFQKHLHTLANLAKLLHKQDFRDGLQLARAKMVQNAGPAIFRELLDLFKRCFVLVF